MKDLEDLLPNKSLIPPPTEEEPPPPGTHTYTPLLRAISHLAPSCPHHSFCSLSVFSDVVIEKSSKSPKTKQRAAGKGVNLQKEVSLAAPNPRAPVTRAPGPRGPPGNARGPQPGPGRGRGRGGPPRH